MAGDLTTRLVQRWGSIERAVADDPVPAHETRRGPATRSWADLQPVAVLTLGDSLGEGGMGSLRLGRQAALERTVAVKSVRADRANDESLVRLLHEAFVMARLEHPNIVPIHELAQGAGGEPLIVMRRIEGSAWSDLLAAPGSASARFGIEDELEWHLRVFMTVCSAVAYAHSRSILHLDIKPSNVMIGPFGEVYLIDWGIALSCDPAERRIPLAADLRDVIGTPSYLAPEMLAADGRELGPFTDVALLGATLYEVLCGHAPFRGPHLLAIVHQIVHTAPDWPPGVEPELRRIVERAMAKEPAHRTPDAERLRREVQAFLEHHDSSRIAANARQKEGEMIQALAETPAAAFALGSAARFGYAQALDAWPGNDDAQEGWRRLTVRLADRALAMEEIGTAQDLAGELNPPDPGLAERLVLAEQRFAEEQAREEDRRRVVARLDKGIGQRTRWFVLMMIGLWWTATPLLGLWTQRDRWPGGWRALVQAPLVSLLLLVGLGYWARDSMSRSDINQRTLYFVLVTMVMQLFGLYVAFGIGVSPLHSLMISPLIWISSIALFAGTTDRRVAPGMVGYLFVVLVGPWRPDWMPALVTFGNLVLVGTLGLVWRPPTLLPPRKAPAGR